LTSMRGRRTYPSEVPTGLADDSIKRNEERLTFILEGLCGLGFAVSHNILFFLPVCLFVFRGLFLHVVIYCAQGCALDGRIELHWHEGSGSGRRLWLHLDGGRRTGKVQAGFMIPNFHDSEYRRAAFFARIPSSL
jgi:hypothetical protein